MTAENAPEKENGVVGRRDVLVGLASVGAGVGLGSPTSAAEKNPLRVEARAAVADDSSDNSLTWMPAWKLRQLIGRRELSPVQVTDHFLRRIEKLDPVLKAFYKVDYDGAREQAILAEKAVMSKDSLGPLHGVPIAFKANVPVSGMPEWTFPQWTDRPRKTVIESASRDAISVARIRQAGAIIVGTTWMELGSRNPWDISREPGNSSSGSAAAAAGALVPVAIGNDGAGSVRSPAAWCGLVGLHGTCGRVPSIDRDRLTPGLYGLEGTERRNREDMIAHQITEGPMTRSVRDAAILFQIMAGPDGRDFNCLPDDAHDYLANLDKGVQGLRIAWTDDYGYGAKYATAESKRVADIARNAAMSLIPAGAVVDEIGTVWEQRSIGSGRSYDDELEARGRCWSVFKTVFEKFDLLLSPTRATVAPKIRLDGTPNPRGVSYTDIYNWVGFPALNAPAGFLGGLPVGLQISGPPNSEARILQVAQTLVGVNRI